MIEAQFTGMVRGERGRVLAQGSRSDRGGDGTLLAIQEVDGTWVFYPPIGECGVRLSAEDAAAVAEAILTRVR